MSAIQSVSPAVAKRMLDDGALLIDIRQPEEYAREHIPHAQLHPLAQLSDGSDKLSLSAASSVIFHCLSGMRSEQNAAMLAQTAAPAKVYLLSGGLNAWKKAGLEVQVDHHQPIDIMRQVQITAGIMILAGVILGYTVSAVFFLLSGLVGAGLLFAGMSGRCGLARILSAMPWNSR